RRRIRQGGGRKCKRRWLDCAVSCRIIWAGCTACISSTVCRTRSSYSSGLGVASLPPPSTVNLQLLGTVALLLHEPTPWAWTPRLGDFSISNFHPGPTPGNLGETIFGVRKVAHAEGGWPVFGLPPLKKCRRRDRDRLVPPRWMDAAVCR